MKRKRILSLIVTLLVLFNVNLDVFASGAIEENTNVEQMNEKDAIIQQLFDDRATLLSEFDMIENESEEDKYTIALNEIDLRLAQLGVTFHTAEEVATQFPETKNNKELALLGETAVAQPKATKPTSSVNTWASYRTTYTYEGVSYNIQRLVAQPKSDSSPLRDTGTRTVTHSKSWTAGAGKVITSLAESGIGSIPGATTYLTFYNAAKAFISGMSTTTEVKAPKIAYTWSSTTTAVFTYVRKSSQTDDYQWLSLISTKNKTVVGYDIPSFTYKAGSTWLMEPEVVQGKHTIESVPSGYDDNSVALAAYTTVSGGPIHRAVSFVKISGPESNTVQKISICYPNFPLHCE